MTATALKAYPSAIVYPDSDGKPMAENTKQLRWIVVLFGNLAALFREAVDVFVGADLFWYPEEGQEEVKQAPDVLVVFGRPKGDRGSYKQWQEGDVPMTVVFEIVSPGNDYLEFDEKRDFYEEHGVEEYYVYDPERNWLKVFVRRGEVFRRVRPLEGFVSPRLGIRFDLSGPEMVVYNPDGTPFLSFEQLKALAEQLKAERDQERRLRLDAQKQAEDAQKQAQDAQKQAEDAQKQAQDAQKQADSAARRVARLAELSRKARRQQASSQELEELERLENESSEPS